jgi:hypothetical protein
VRNCDGSVPLSLSGYNYSFFLASNDSTESERDQREILRVLQGSPHQAEEIAHFFYERTRRLIILKSYTLSDKGVMFVDVVRDVLRYVPLYWTATELACHSETIYLTSLTGG